MLEVVIPYISLAGTYVLGLAPWRQNRLLVDAARDHRAPVRQAVPGAHARRAVDTRIVLPIRCGLPNRGDTALRLRCGGNVSITFCQYSTNSLRDTEARTMSLNVPFFLRASKTDIELARPMIARST